MLLKPAKCFALLFIGMMFLSLVNLWGRFRPYRLLILHSYQTDYPWVPAVHNGILDALKTENLNNFEIKTEYLDSKRNWTWEKEQNALEYLEKKYQQYSFDAIITSDNDAYDFMRIHGNRLFGSVPWVFCGVNDPQTEDLRNLQGKATGVIEFVNYDKTIHLITQLIPRLQKLYILADVTSTGIKNKKEVQRVLQASFPTLAYEIIQPTSYSELLSFVGSLSKNDAILLLAYSLDSEGLYVPYQKVAQDVSSSSGCPVFGVWDFNLGQGIVGGAITSGRIQGQEAGKLLLAILSGQKPETIPVTYLKDTPYMLDWQIMQKWQLPMNCLPKERVLINTPKNLLKENPYLVPVLLGMIVVILLLTIFILILKKAYKGLGQSHIQITQQLSEKESLLREVNHRVRNNLQIIVSLLHLQQSFTGNKEVNSVLLDMENRIRSMELVHSESYENSNLDELDLYQYIYMLGNYLSVSSDYGVVPSFTIVPAPNKPCLLSLQRIIPLGLLLNELITNSIKYAHDDQNRCSIYVDLSKSSDGVWHITYWDSGSGIPADLNFDNPRTLGFQLMNVLAAQAKVRLERDRQDLRKIYITI